MAVSNRDRVGRAFESLAAGLGPYVDRRMRQRSPLGDRWFADWASHANQREATLRDPSALLRVITECWDTGFKDEFTKNDRNLVFELRDTRNRWAHNDHFSHDDAYRALDSVERLLTRVDAAEATDVGNAKSELMRLKYEADARKATPKGDALVTLPAAGLTPWREVIEPHDDVAGGRFSMAEFAADLHLVSLGEGRAEYVDPVEFFQRTFLTAGLRQLLIQAAQRLAGGEGGAPIVDLQTNFGGGKTHSMIALYHLCSGRRPGDLPQEIQDLLAVALGGEALPEVRRAVLVGTKLTPGQPTVKPDGTTVRTMWGELAWQLGGADAFEVVAGSDASSTSPGDLLRDVIAAAAPCLILIDEWVAYARQLFGAEDLPGGSFDTHFTFAQALTEATRAVSGAVLVISIPASESIDGDSGVGSEAEVGGVGGREALARLRNVVGRMEASWRPASAEESFEIVRRRLFKPIDASRLPDRDATARTFGDLYRTQAAEFPPECRDPGYVERIKAAYPIHPELFARLYGDWSTLERFQRTRGVLRLMAQVVSSLWAAGDQAPLILPASVPLEDAAVVSELDRNLEDNWKPIIDADVDGPHSLPRLLDDEVTNLGRYRAARRVARTVFIGSAPTARSANRGLEGARVRLGCVQPGESVAIFGDALNRLAARASYFYSDGGRYWYGTQPGVTSRAQDRADELLANRVDEVDAHVVDCIRGERGRAEFTGVHIAPASSGDVPDDRSVRLVILSPAQAHIPRAETSDALTAAANILERRASGARDHRNMVVFLAADQRRLDDLRHAAADFLAWQSIDDDAGADGLNLDPQQLRQAKSRLDDAGRAVALRLAETYLWALVPDQPQPNGPLLWNAQRADGQGSLAERVSRRLISEGILYASFAPSLLRQRLDGVLAPLWTDGAVAVGRLWDVFARYTYLPRLRDNAVLEACVAQGPAGFAWDRDGFAVADSYDEAAGRYRGLVVGEHATSITAASLVVRPDVAEAQRAAEANERSEPPIDGETPTSAEPPVHHPGILPPPDEKVPRRRTRFYGVVRLNAERLNRDFGKVSQEVITQLAAQIGTDVTVTVEVTASRPDGFEESTMRTVSENAATLHFESHSFEDE